jgi:hypothetical protein
LKRHEHWLDDPDVKRWHDNQSIIWGDVALRALGRFCEDTKISPKEFVQLTDKEMADRAHDYVHRLQKKINPKNDKPYSPG